MEVGKLKSESLPSFDTHVPYVGTVDLNSPIEWLWWGGLGLNLIFVSGFSKWIIAAGLIAARYEYQKRFA